jgi:hypothetical protein
MVDDIGDTPVVDYVFFVSVNEKNLVFPAVGIFPEISESLAVITAAVDVKHAGSVRPDAMGVSIWRKLPDFHGIDRDLFTAQYHSYDQIPSPVIVSLRRYRPYNIQCQDRDRRYYDDLHNL